MRQKQIRSIGDAISSSTTAWAGAEKIGEAVGLKHNVAATINLKRSELIAAGTANETAKEELRTRRKRLVSATQAAIRHATTARDILKPKLGNHYSTAWNKTGFARSLRIPRSPRTLEPL